MGASIDSEVKTYFTANTNGLVDGVDRGKKKLAEFQKSLSSIKGNILDPVSALGSSATKLATTKLASKLGFTGRAAGGLAAEGALFVKYLTSASSLAGETADRFQGVSESLRQNSKINMFASSIDGLDSLRSKYDTTASLIKEARTAHGESDPYGFGGGFSGNALTAIGNTQSSIKSAVGLGPYSNFERAQNESGTLKLSTDLAEQQKRKLATQYGIEQRNQVGLTDERLQGSGPGLRVAELQRDRQRELNSIKGGDLNTHANRHAIRERYKEEISAEKELQTVADQRFKRDSSNLGIDRSLRTEEAKRLATAQNNLAAMKDELQAHAHMTQEARRALDLDIMRGEIEVRNARSENEVAISRQTLAQKSALVQGSNLSTVGKQYQTEMNTLSALKEQLAAVKGINATKAQGLGISIEESENTIRLTRQSELFGKSPSQIQKHIRHMQRDKIRRDRFDHQQELTDGLINVDHDIGGNITGGLDPITGEHRAPRSGFQQFGTSLISGHVGDRTSVGGKASTLFDHDPDGGLSGGTTPRMFIESDAAKSLRDGPSAEKALASWRGDLAHDPAARLASKSVFGGVPSLRSDPAALVGRGHDTDTSKGRTALDAARGTIDAIEMQTPYIKQMQKDISMIAATWGFQ